MEKEYKFLVCTRCFTYNHASYIKDALHGFVIQETTFPYVCIIVDDASVDGEQDVIMHFLAEHFKEPYHIDETEYAWIYCAEHKSNENCQFVVLLLKYNHHQIKKSKLPYLTNWLDSSKYQAFCEGDDYWTDTRKLQKQVAFLETNPDYTLCFHSVFETFEGRHRLDRIRCKVEDREYSGVEWYKDRPAQLASFMLRSWVVNSDMYRRVIDDPVFKAGDVPLLLTCAHYGKLRGVSEVMSVYRHNETGWTQKKRPKEAVIKIAESELHYSVFGEEYRPIGEGFYCLALVRAFVNTIYSRSTSVDTDYLRLAWNKSKSKTIKSIFILIKKYIKKYFCI